MEDDLEGHTLQMPSRYARIYQDFYQLQIMLLLLFQNCSFIIRKAPLPTAEKKIMSNVWPIAIIALLTIVILFYALEQCGKILKGRQGRNLNKRSPAAQQRKTSNLDTIHEQHVSPSSLHHLGSQHRKKSPFT